MQSWFGSSGGGLPRRPELKSLGRFFLARFHGPVSVLPAAPSHTMRLGAFDRRER
jgi:hypothetical protein